MEARRNPVDYRYDAIDPEFLKMLAMIAAYAHEKYGRWDNYKDGRLDEDRGPVNHIYEHLRQYRSRETYDHFDGSNGWHLAAIAYNAMMEYFYLTHPNIPPAKMV